MNPWYTQETIHFQRQVPGSLFPTISRELNSPLVTSWENKKEFVVCTAHLKSGLKNTDRRVPRVSHLQDFYGLADWQNVPNLCRMRSLSFPYRLPPPVPLGSPSDPPDWLCEGNIPRPADGLFPWHEHYNQSKNWIWFDWGKNRAFIYFFSWTSRI